MPAMFRQVAAYSGVDENLPSGAHAQGIVIPSGGSTLVILEGGNGLDVQSTLPSKVHVYEFKTKQERADAARNASNPSDAMRRFDTGSWRIFSIKGDTPVGFDKVKVEAKTLRTLPKRRSKSSCLTRRPSKLPFVPFKFATASNL